MLKKVITYTDYDGEERTEAFYFNLSKAELLDMELYSQGKYTERLQEIIDAKDHKAIVNTFKDLIYKSYGVKSDDGRRFVKSEEATKAFTETEAFSELYLELATNADAAAAFAIGILPKDLQESASVTDVVRANS